MTVGSRMIRRYRNDERNEDDQDRILQVISPNLASLAAGGITLEQHYRSGSALPSHYSNSTYS